MLSLVVVKQTPLLVYLVLGWDRDLDLVTPGHRDLQNKLRFSTDTKLKYLGAVVDDNAATGSSRYLVTHWLLLYGAGLILCRQVCRLVLEGQEGKGLWRTVHRRDHPFDSFDCRLALLPGNVPAVVVPCPDLGAIDDLPEACAVLLGDVIALVSCLIVILQNFDLIAPRQSLHFHLGFRNDHRVILLGRYAFFEEFHLHKF